MKKFIEIIRNKQFIWFLLILVTLIVVFQFNNFNSKKIENSKHLVKNEIYKILSDSSVIEDLKKMKKLQKEGIAKQHFNNCRDVIDFFNKIDYSKFNESKLFWNIGFCRSELGNNEAAIKDYNKSINLDNSDFKAYLLRGISKARLKDYKSSIVDFDKALELSPNNKNILLARGISRVQLRLCKASMEDFNKVLKLNPDDNILAIALTYKGICKILLKDYKGSLEDLEQAKKLCIKNGKKDKQIKEITKLMEISAKRVNKRVN